MFPYRKFDCVKFYDIVWNAMHGYGNYDYLIYGKANKEEDAEIPFEYGIGTIRLLAGKADTSDIYIDTFPAQSEICIKNIAIDENGDRKVVFSMYAEVK